jgi:hypothetical protein
MRSLRSASIGSISAWLPSRRSTLHQTGGFVITRDGPRAVVKRDGLERAVLAGRIDLHGLPRARMTRVT